MGFGTFLGIRIPWSALALWRRVRAAAFRAAGRLLGSRLRRPFDPSRCRRILVIRNDRIGDAILATPFLACLRRAFPASWIAILASRANAEAFRRLPEVSEVMISTGDAVRRGCFDLAIDLYAYAHLGTALTASLVGAIQRVGHDTDGRGFLFTVPVPFDPRVKYEPERSLDLLRHLGLPVAGDDPIRFPIRPEERAEAEALLGRAGAGGDGAAAKLVAIHPGSGERYAESRRLAPWKLARVAGALGREWGYRVLITGGTSERFLAADLASRLAEPPIVAAGETSLGVTAALLERAAFVVVGDTGILHLARAVGTPVVAILGPTGDVNGAARLLPAEGDHVIVRHDLGCADCNLLRCRTFACLQAVSPEEILEGCRVMIGRLDTRARAA